MPTTAGAEAQFAPQATADGDGSDSSAWVEKKKKERTPQVKDGIDIRLKVVRAQLEYVLTEPRFTKGGVHVFEAIARRHGIKSVSIDRNFKIGARSKKPPTVWIAGPDGSEDQLLKAKDDLLVLFDTHTNRITLKLDIPHELHFAIIGKRGEHQRSIMSQTGCHIHFPDLNKGGPRTAIKNQVSISGTPDGSETARLKLRGL